MEGYVVQKIQTICVFCGSSFGKDREFINVAHSLGNLLAKRKIKLVYEGGNLGLMGCVATTAFLGTGKVLGIIPQALADKNLTRRTLGDDYKVPSLHERISSMLYNADAFITLHGGLETLEEIFSISSLTQLNFHKKPIGLLNVNGFYDGLLSFLDHCVTHEFIKPPARQIIISGPTAGQLIDLLQAYVPKSDPILSQIEWQGNGSSSKKRGLDTSLQL